MNRREVTLSVFPSKKISSHLYYQIPKALIMFQQIVVTHFSNPFTISHFMKQHKSFHYLFTTN